MATQRSLQEQLKKLQEKERQTEQRTALQVLRTLRRKIGAVSKFESDYTLDIDADFVETALNSTVNVQNTSGEIIEVTIAELLGTILPDHHKEIIRKEEKRKEDAKKKRQEKKLQQQDGHYES